jgi:hypothetical protein
MLLEELQTEMAMRLNNLKSIERLVNLDKFKKAWAYADEDGRQEFLKYARNSNSRGCWLWVDAQLEHDIESKTVAQLRILGRQRGVANYHHLDKSQLISELKKCANIS